MLQRRCTVSTHLEDSRVGGGNLVGDELARGIKDRNLHSAIACVLHLDCDGAGVVIFFNFKIIIFHNKIFLGIFI